MALGGGKLGGAKNGRIKPGTVTDGGKFSNNEGPLKDQGGGGGGGDDKRIYLQMPAPPSSSGGGPPQELLDEEGGPPSEEALRSLGPIEKQPMNRRTQKNGVAVDGPVPLSIERQKRGLGGGGPVNPQQFAGNAGGGGMAPSASASATGPMTSMSEVNIINHTDVSLKMIAIDSAGTGAKVERQLAAKSADNFIAPIGCTISIIHPVTKKAVFRYKVSKAYRIETHVFRSLTPR